MPLRVHRDVLVLATLRLGRNGRDYRLGNQFKFNAWVDKAWLPWLDTSFRLGWLSWGNVRGADGDLNPMMVPTADPDRRGGNRLDAILGAGANINSGWFAGNRLGVEVGLPLYQDLDGPQLETDWHITLGIQKMLH